MMKLAGTFFCFVLFFFFPFYIHIFRDVPVCVCVCIKERARIFINKERAPVCLSAAIITTLREHTDDVVALVRSRKKKRERQGDHARTTKPSTPPIFSFLFSFTNKYNNKNLILLTLTLIQFMTKKKQFFKIPSEFLKNGDLIFLSKKRKDSALF